MFFAPPASFIENYYFVDSIHIERESTLDKTTCTNKMRSALGHQPK